MVGDHPGRARVELSTLPERSAWYAGEELRRGAASERDAIAARGWDRFVAGVNEALPQPYDPLLGASAWRASTG